MRKQDTPGNLFAALSEDQIQDLKGRAAKSDGAAAFRLSTYYAFCTAQKKEADYWLIASAKAHYPKGIYELKRLGEVKADSDNASERAEGRRLLLIVRNLK